MFIREGLEKHQRRLFFQAALLWGEDIFLAMVGGPAVEHVAEAGAVEYIVGLCRVGLWLAMKRHYMGYTNPLKSAMLGSEGLKTNASQHTIL